MSRISIMRTALRLQWLCCSDSICQSWLCVPWLTERLQSCSNHMIIFYSMIIFYCRAVSITWILCSNCSHWALASTSSVYRWYYLDRHVNHFSGMHCIVIRLYVGFVDDLHGLAEFGPGQIDLFRDYLNSRDSTITVTFEHSVEVVSYLDLSIYTENCRFPNGHMASTSLHWWSV